jgi:hypothetical protein
MMMHNQKITNFDDNDYAKYSIIKPPADFLGDDEKYTRVVIDSRVRNKDLFPDPNNYEVLLDDDINDAIKAQLVYVDIPFTNFLINKDFNTLVVRVGGTDHKVALSTGDYDTTSLVTEIQAKLDAVLGAAVITVSHIPRIDSFSFSSSASFTLKFDKQQNTLAHLLGFRDNKDYVATGSGPYIVTAEFRKNFNYNNYIIMTIDQFDLLKSVDKCLNKSFAMIPKNYDVLNLADHPEYIKRFSPPIAKLSKLKVRFYDRFGNDYDFQNMDHRFELLVTSFKQKRKYGNIFAS